MLRFGLLSAFLVATVAAQCPDGSTGFPAINGQCPGNLVLINMTCCNNTIASTTTRRPTTVRPNTCVDLINRQTGRSDCPNLVNLCNEAPFRLVLADSCPRTCRRCNAAPITTRANSPCVDVVSRQTGRSDCQGLRNLCNQPAFRSVMINSCPRSCGFCR